MLSINLIVNYLYRKYGVPLHNVFEKWTRGISNLKILTIGSQFGYILFVEKMLLCVFL